jgi:RHS repeat-associated protein
MQNTPFINPCVGIRSTSDYSGFGVQLDGRTSENEGYRYGFQGQEKDDEIKGEGNSVNYTFRMHDPRVGRFFARDPLSVKYPHYSPYSFSGNRVIDAIELEGLEEFILINNGSSYTLVWDITARGSSEKGVYGGKIQTGTIMVVDNSGQIIENVRALTAEELGYSWISERRLTKTPAKKYEGTKWKGQYEGGEINHAIDGTKASLGFGSTGFVGDDNWVTREMQNVPLDFNLPQPPPPTPANLTSAGSTKAPLTQSVLNKSLSGGYSTFGHILSGGQITPIVNPSSVPGSASGIGQQLSGTSFSSLTFDVTLYLANNNSLRFAGSGVQNKVAGDFATEIRQQIAKSAGVNKSKVNVNVSFTTDPAKSSFKASFQ